MKTQSGEIDIKVPRDRNGSFESKIIGKYSRNSDGMEEKILALYSCGMSQRDIAEQIKELCYFLNKSFNYPISARDTGNDLVRQRANSIAQSLDNFFQRSKYPVTESTLSNFFPNLFNRVHFRRIWGDIEKDNIIRQI